MKKKLMTLVFASFTLLLSVGGHADTPVDALHTWSEGKWMPDFAAAKRLIENGADVNATATGDSHAARSNYTALHLIMHYSYAGDHITKLHNTGLYQDAFEVLDLLVKSGADVNARDRRGWTPLQVANLASFSRYRKASTEQIEFSVKAIDLLVTNGADINEGEGEENSYILNKALSVKFSIKVIEELLAHGADPNVTLYSGRTIWERAEGSARGFGVVEEVANYNKAVFAAFNNADELRARKKAQLAGGGSSSGGGSSTQTEEAKADATPLYSCVSPEEADSQQDKLPTDSKVQYFPPDLGKDLCYNCNQEDLDKWNKPDCALFGFNDLESSVYNNCDAPLVVGWCNRENRGDEKCERLDWSYTLEHEDRLQVNHFNFDEDGTVLYAFCYAPQRPKVNP